MKLVILLALGIALALPEESNPKTGHHVTSRKGLKSVLLKLDVDHSILSVDRGILERFITNQARPELEQAGITVVSEKEINASSDVPLLGLETIVRCDETTTCGYQVSFSLSQRVQLMRDQSVAVTASTWRNSYTGSIRKRDLATLPDLLAADAGSMLLGFVADDYAANPR
jgi:hypothetical protein